MTRNLSECCIHSALGRLDVDFSKDTAKGNLHLLECEVQFVAGQLGEHAWDMHEFHHDGDNDSNEKRPDAAPQANRAGCCCLGGIRNAHPEKSKWRKGSHQKTDSCKR